jgi:DNA-binding winged helix-turn-helix (wHTH) protein
MKPQTTYRIGGDFLLNPEDNTLTKPDGSVQSIEPLLVALMVYLIEHTPEPVTHELLIAVFWGPTVKGPEALMKAVSKIRKLFPFNVIKTISKVGYAWTAGVSAYEMPKRRFIQGIKTIARIRPANLFFLGLVLVILKAIFFPHH